MTARLSDAFSQCRLCGGGDLRLVADLGELPVSRPHRPRPEPDARFRLAVHVCDACGLIQVLDPAPPELLYVDAENYTTAFQKHPHVDELIRMLLAHTDGGSVLEIGCNDGGFLESLRAAGFAPLVGVEPNRPASAVARDRGFAVHTALFDEELARAVVAGSGPVDLVAARHVVEHVTDLAGFFRAIDLVLKPGGHFLIELPHTEPGLNAGSPSLLWEEHVNYFLEPTIRAMLEAYGYRPEVLRYYTFGGGIVAFLARRSGAATTAVTVDSAGLPWDAIAAYGDGVARCADALRRTVAAAKAAGRGVAVYGAANRSAIAINHAGIGADVDFVIDDRDDLQEQVFPGARPPIRRLADTTAPAGGLLCLLGVGAEAERKVAARVRERFPDQPLTFASLVYPRDVVAGLDRACAELAGALPPATS